MLLAGFKYDNVPSTRYADSKFVDTKGAIQLWLFWKNMGLHLFWNLMLSGKIKKTASARSFWLFTCATIEWQLWSVVKFNPKCPSCTQGSNVDMRFTISLEAFNLTLFYLKRHLSQYFFTHRLCHEIIKFPKPSLQTTQWTILDPSGFQLLCDISEYYSGKDKVVITFDTGKGFPFSAMVRVNCKLLS